jgi:glutamyl-tRNA reductase
LRQKKQKKLLLKQLDLRNSLRHLEVEPIIANIRSQAEIIRLRETEKAYHMLGDMNGKEKVVDHLTKVVVDRVFYDIIHNLKEAAENDDTEVIKTAKYLFKNKT